jgi:hypothetical protein
MTCRLHCSLLLLLGLASSATAAEPGDEGMVPLFDGTSFAGWKKVGGGATYTIEGDTIVGKVGPGTNSFLRTEKTYGDFVLKVDLKLDVPTNSGIQFRSHQQPSDDGNGRVYGYQCEVDPLPRAWSGGLYEEGRRLWLFPLEGHDEARKAFKLDDWNHFTISAFGPHLRTWLNGVPCADLIDAMELEGFIALQVHAGKAGQIRFRNIRLKDLGQSTRLPLWDGSSLVGWTPKGPGQWRIEEGAIHGTHASTQQEASTLIRDRPNGDFALRLKFKEAKGHFGVALAHDGDRVWLPTWGRPEKSNPPDAKKSVPKAVEPKDGWHQFDLIVLGGRIVVQLNGLTITDFPDDQSGLQRRVAIGLEGGQECDVAIKDITILPLHEARSR